MGRRSTRSSIGFETCVSTRPFPPGFIPVIGHECAGRQYYTPQDAFEPTFLPDSLQSPIHESRPAECPYLSSSSTEHSPARSRTRLRSESRSPVSARGIKLLCQSVLKINHRHPRHELGNSPASTPEKPVVSSKLSPSCSFKKRARNLSLQTRDRAVLIGPPEPIPVPERISSLPASEPDNIENTNIQPEKCREAVDESELEAIEELNAEAIRIAFSEKGHSRQRSRDSVPKTNVTLLNFQPEPWHSATVTVNQSPMRCDSLK